jgi:ligand-binding SRPBCC domain-containing protein
MPSHTIKTIQKIPASLQEVWDFFSEPANLHTITPANMKFRVISQHPADRIYAGQIIEYRVSPLFGIPLYWMTEITHVEDKKFFSDEQRRGPYKFWHHQHHFKEIDGGVEMTDIVHYRNPFWIAGELANMLIVKKKLTGVFNYRFQKTEEIFGKWKGEREF